MSHPPLYKREFARWLATFEDDDVVGFRGDNYSCPIATWLKITTGNANITVGKSQVLFGYEGVRRLPPWARDFVDAVDGDLPNAVRAGKARAILEEETR